MRLLLITALIGSVILVVTTFNIDENLDPEEAWNIYNSNIRPLNKGLSISGTELNLRYDNLAKIIIEINFKDYENLENSFLWNVFRR